VSSLPSVSVILPVRNEGHFIAQSLEAVLIQDYPADRMQVIVVDGMSTDGTRELIRGMQNDHPHLWLIDNPEQIVSTGLNRAFAHVHGDIVVRVDGHCKIARDYVRRCVEHILADGVDGVGGPVTTIGESASARAIAAAMSSPFGVGDSAFRTGVTVSNLADTVPFPAYTRSIMERAGPYDQELVRNQDDEYNYRLRKLGAKILLATDIHSEYYSRTSLASLRRQYYQYGYWKVRVMQKHAAQMRPRQFVPACFVVALLCALCVAPFTNWGLTAFAVIGGLYVAANLVASSKEWAARRLKPSLVLPAAYLIIHVSYGSGFLIGLVRFWNRWGDRTGPPERKRGA
jgi:succinoglycan biosynthesis protein ExoA